MKGTSTVQTRAMERTPPRMTEAVSRHTSKPMSARGMPKVSWARKAMLLACTMQPMPKEANAVKTAKRIPSHFIPKPRSKAYMGPP